MIKLSSKALGSVVATALLLVVAVITVTGFQSWFQTYQSGINTNVEQSSTLENLNLANLIGGYLYLSGSGNIESVNINGNNCYVSGVYNSKLNSIPISNCTETGENNIVIVATSGVYSFKKYLKSSNYKNPCPENWSLVPGNIDLGTRNFCVMKYEAKWNGKGVINDSSNMYCGNGNDDGTNDCPIDGSVGVASKANWKPLTQITQLEARQLCKNLGSKYHLIRDEEWVSIARNIELQPNNWANGIIGSLILDGGGLKRGNVGINDSASYDGNDPEESSDLVGNDKGKLTLSNGEIIWDFSGNAWEWTNNSFKSNKESSLGIIENTTSWHEWTEIENYDYLKSINKNYNSSNGIGKLLPDVDDAYPSGTNHIFLRGGGWGTSEKAGIFSFGDDHSDLYSYLYFGFRCAYTP